MMDRFEQERRLHALGLRRLAGVDEAGRGALAGPVVAAAVILPEEWILQGMPSELRGLNDSKQLTPLQREHYFNLLMESQAVMKAVEAVDADTVDRLNILNATELAMQRAVAKLQPPPHHILVDGRPVRTLGPRQTALIKGDALSYSIAAASVLAKVTRDRLMRDFDQQYPNYGFAIHKGYGTALHLEAISKFGPSPLHRRSFAPMNSAHQPELF